MSESKSQPSPPASLRDFQDWMLGALVRPEGTSGPELDARVHPPARVRLGTYQRSYIARLGKCLAGQFPALCHALGPELFDDFAREYLRAHPSTSHSLYALGRRFPAWLEAQRPDRDAAAAQREAWIDFMVDLADYEWRLFELFDGPGPERERERQPTADCPDAELALQPHLVLAEHRFPVAWYYHEVRAGRRPSVPRREPSASVLLRRDYATSTFPVTALHLRFLTCARERGSVAAGLVGLAEVLGRPLAEIEAAWAAQREGVRRPWIEAGFFIRATPRSRP